MNTNSLKFYGASGTVTGSLFMLELTKIRILIDCGMYQGVDVEVKNAEPFQFDPTTISAVLITHSHLDHIGLLPKLVRNGFNGPIFLTAQTAQIAEVILYDSAKLQEYNEDKSAAKLYDSNDVAKTISQFSVIEFNKEQLFENNIKFRFLPAGHILGAASVFIESEGKSFVFSGDLGRTDQSIIESLFVNDFSSISPNYIIMESLYGGESHSDKNADVEKMIEIINQVYASGGKVIIPVFALHRAQEILEILKFLYLKAKISNSIKVYLDSPMALDITKIYEDNYSSLSPNFSMLKETFKLDGNAYPNYFVTAGFTNQNRFKFENLKEVRKSKKSQKISRENNALILAGSGMADGGRVVKHLLTTLPDPRSAVFFVGFQAEGTLGRELVDGAKTVRIYDQDVQVKARIEYFRGFSAHASGADLEAWLKKFNLTNLQEIFLVHAEPERALVFKTILSDLGYNPTIAEAGMVREI